MARTVKPVLVLLMLLASVSLFSQRLRPSDPLAEYLRETDTIQQSVVEITGRVRNRLDKSMEDYSGDTPKLEEELSVLANQINDELKRLDKLEVPAEAKSLHQILREWHTGLEEYTRTQNARVCALKSARRALEEYNVHSPPSKKKLFEQAQAICITTFADTISQAKTIRKLENDIAAERVRLGARDSARKANFGSVAYPP